MHVTQSCPPPLIDAGFGIWFDGRAYHYQQYRYERLEDALSYARVDQGRPGFHSVPLPDHWEKWSEPDQAEEVQMAPFGISYEHGRYCYGPFRYDVLDDALDYARRTGTTT